MALALCLFALFRGKLLGSLKSTDTRRTTLERKGLTFSASRTGVQILIGFLCLLIAVLSLDGFRAPSTCACERAYESITDYEAVWPLLGTGLEFDVFAS